VTTGGSSESLARSQELLERLNAKLADLERAAESGETDGAVDDLAEIAEIAKEIEAEIQRARQAADAGA
jgi:hypothetical protein